MEFDTDATYTSAALEHSAAQIDNTQPKQACCQMFLRDDYTGNFRKIEKRNG